MANLIGVDIFDLMISRLVGLGLIVSSVFFVSIGPFIYLVCHGFLFFFLSSFAF